MPYMKSKAFICVFAAAILARRCVQYKDPTLSIVTFCTSRFSPTIIKVSGLKYLSCPLQIRKIKLPA